MMPMMKPERLNGKTILKPYVRSSDGIMQKLDSSSAFHPPSVEVRYPILPLTQLAHMAGKQISAGGICTTSKLEESLLIWLRRAAAQEREKIVKELRDAGNDLVARAVDRINYKPE